MRKVIVYHIVSALKHSRSWEIFTNSIPIGGGCAMRNLRVLVVLLAIVGLPSVASASPFVENFDSYAAGSSLHGQGGWKGWAPAL